MSAGGRVDAAELSAALGERIEQLAADLVGAGPTSKSRMDLRFRARGSLAVITAGQRRGIWCDHEAGVGGDPLDLVRHLRGGSMADAISWAAGWLGIVDRGVPKPAQRPAAPIDPPEAQSYVDLALALFREAKAAVASPAETYLAARGCRVPCGDVIRFHPACPRRDPDRGLERLPAMLAAMTDPVTNEFAGVHRTFLRPDGCGKAENGKAKMMLGKAGVVRLSPDDDVRDGLGICEGIETGLALMQRASWAPIWAMGSAGGMAKFPVLRFIRCLTLFPDMDDKGAGAKAADACALRWISAGCEVQTFWPRDGSDWHDCLVGKAA